MGGSFRIKHGGIVRWSAVASSSESTYWGKGRVLRLDTTGQLRVHDGSAGLLTGLALEKRIDPTAVGINVTLNKVGAPTGARYSMLLDKAVVLDDEIRSGINFEAGDIIYTDTSGKLTTSGSGTGPNSPKLGVALSQGRSGDAARPVEFLFDVSY